MTYRMGIELDNAVEMLGEVVGVDLHLNQKGDLFSVQNERNIDISPALSAEAMEMYLAGALTMSQFFTESVMTCEDCGSILTSSDMETKHWPIPVCSDCEKKGAE